MAEEEKEEEEAVRDISHQIEDVSEVEHLPSNYMMSSSESHPTTEVVGFPTHTIVTGTS